MTTNLVDSKGAIEGRTKMNIVLHHTIKHPLPGSVERVATNTPNLQIRRKIKVADEDENGNDEDNNDDMMRMVNKNNKSKKNNNNNIKKYKNNDKNNKNTNVTI